MKVEMDKVDIFIRRCPVCKHDTIQVRKNYPGNEPSQCMVCGTFLVLEVTKA